MTNCIVWGHDTEQVTAGKNVNYCDIEGAYATGAGNIDANPLFVDASVLDYQLSEFSPCIDTGVYASVDYDCIGTPWPLQDGCDIGAYEFVPEPGFVISYRVDAFYE